MVHIMAYTRMNACIESEHDVFDQIGAVVLQL